ncbi:MAG: preprotein translocase subunit SecG [Pseudomonadota bacterium]
MQNVILLVHLLLTLSLIVVVLLQRSEGGGLGMGGGGPAGTGRAAATGLGKLTWVLGISLFATSIALTIIAAQNSAGSSVLDRLIDLPPPSAEEVVPEDGGLGDSLLPPTPGNEDAPLLPTLD